jgi:uncharacterized protein
MARSRHLSLHAPLRSRGVIGETMSTGAAVRTYDLLLVEDRRVGALLIAVE